MSLITAAARIAKIIKGQGKFGSVQTNLAKTTENVSGIGDLLKAAEGNIGNLRQRIADKIDNAFDVGYQNAFTKAQSSGFDRDMPRMPMPDNREIIDLGKREYLRQLDRTLGGEHGMVQLHEAMPESFGPRLGELVDDVAAKISNDVSEFAMGSRGYDGDGLTNNHLSLRKRSNEAIKKHMDEINDIVKKESESFIAHSGEYDSWEDFQRLNINKGIIAKQKELIEAQKNARAILNQPPFSRDKSIQLQEIESKIKKVNQNSTIVLKKDELMRSDFLEDISVSGKSVNGSSLGYKVHYLDDNGLKFEISLRPGLKSKYRKSMNPNRISGGAHYIDEGLYVEGVPSDAIKQKWARGYYLDEGVRVEGAPTDIIKKKWIDAGIKEKDFPVTAAIKEKDFPMSKGGLVEGSVNIGRMNAADLQAKVRAGEDLSVHTMEYDIRPLLKQDGGQKTERLDRYLESLGLPTVDDFNRLQSGYLQSSRSSFQINNSNYQKALDKWVTAEQTRESRGVMNALGIMDFGAEYASNSLSPHSLRVLMTEGKNSKRLGKRASKQFKDNPEEAGGLIGGSRQSLFYQATNNIEKGSAWPALVDEYRGAKINFNAGTQSVTSLSGRIEMFPFQKVTKTGELKRSRAGKTISVDDFNQQFNKGGKESETMSELIKTAVANKESITIEGLGKAARAVNPKGFSSKLAVINSFARSIRDLTGNSTTTTLKGLFNKILPDGVSHKQFVESMGKYIFDMDKEYKQIFGNKANIFIKPEFKYDSAGNIASGMYFNVYHTGMKISKSVDAKRIMKSFRGIVAGSFGDKIIVRDRGEKK